jgi:membrane protease YdiL (CAAX protease family)
MNGPAADRAVPVLVPVRLELPPAAVAAGGAALLLSRPFLSGTPSAGFALAAGYVVLAAASLAASPGDERPRTATTAVLGLGLAAVLAATWMTAPPPPVPTGGAGAILLTSLAAVSEEAFFRRFLYGRMLRYGAGVAVAGSALAFALVHLPAYGWPALPIDLGAGLLFSWQRWASGRWSVPAATHVVADLLAVMR